MSNQKAWHFQEGYVGSSRIYGTNPFCPKTAFQKCRGNCGKKTLGVFTILYRYLYVGIYLGSLLKQFLNHNFR